MPHIIVWSLVKSLLNKRKLMVRHVLGGSKDIQGRSKGISRVSWKQVTLPSMQWKYVIWIGCAGCGALLDFKSITPYGLVEYSHSETCAKLQHTHQKNGHLLQDGVCHKIFDSDH